MIPHCRLYGSATIRLVMEASRGRASSWDNELNLDHLSFFTYTFKHSSRGTPVKELQSRHSSLGTPVESSRGIQSRHSRRGTPVQALQSKHSSRGTPVEALPLRHSRRGTPVEALRSRHSGRGTPVEALQSRHSGRGRGSPVDAPVVAIQSIQSTLAIIMYRFPRVKSR